jgi:hypothetical protein
VHPALLTAAGYNGSNPAVALNLLGGLVSLPLAPHGGNQARRQSASGAGGGVHEGIVRMHAGELVNLFVMQGNIECREGQRFRSYWDILDPVTLQSHWCLPIQRYQAKMSAADRGQLLRWSETGKRPQDRVVPERCRTAWC